MASRGRIRTATRNTGLRAKSRYRFRGTAAADRGRRMRDRSESFERPLGAFPAGDGAHAEFRVWAPRPEAVRLRVDGREHELADAGHGILEATVEARPGADYRYVLDGTAFPDPASRWQPE